MNEYSALPRVNKEYANLGKGRGAKLVLPLLVSSLSLVSCNVWTGFEKYKHKPLVDPVKEIHNLVRDGTMRVVKKIWL
jgi:hypothetical protein